jgi:prepilin-type N-terminal cleavage/methylation domain-containing protein
MRKQLGFTLVEIAIVLFIVGLLLGGVLKGQELIRAARVNNIAAQLDEVKVAYLGFLDRYRTYPGDMPTAQAAVQIPGTGSVGCAAASTCANGRIDPNENILVWYHLSRAGFISGSYTGITDAGAAIQTPTSADSPSNRYGGFLVLVNDNDYGDINAVTKPVLNLKTGGLMPVALIAELDRKLDDGQPGTGSFRIGIAYGGVNPAVGACLTGAANNNPGMLYNASQNIEACGGVAIQ